MTFNSFIFLIFIVAFFAIWPFLKTNKFSRWIFLIIASCIFYGWWDWKCLFLIAISGSLDYSIGIAIFRFPKYKRLLLLSSLVGNVGLLLVFKYSAFLIANTHLLFSTLGLNAQLPSEISTVSNLAPIGISFYTFQSMSYTIDIYRSELKPTRNVLHFFAYLSLFPQLIAGPIVRARELLPQLARQSLPNSETQWAGTKLIIYGYFQKVVIADNLAPLVSWGFNSPSHPDSALFWWLIVSAFAFQIYYDFSGYSSIAQGLAKWMGYDFQSNFNSPYAAKSLREFWERWHISLSTWFRDYVYIPLGGGQRGNIRAHLNMWVTMVISGLWHGAAWTFIVWGGIHASMLSIERVLNFPKKILRLPCGRLLANIFILTQVWCGWVFFRATSFGQAVDILDSMFSFDLFLDLTVLISWERGMIVNQVLFLGLGILVEFLYTFRHRLQIYQKQYCWGEQIGFTMMVFACVYMRGPGSIFIYFQF